ncbi:hypothetical protein HPB47_023382 [Ixodes persulcatus]|uniref:Uncharacterized protein n=1 Tax=Ixodes persulcatus TaxID=34615 RepID=A0AC60QAB8_IXOPE|nr:hypothetical protein HPB47_023382 [Ixodes persulcatus]
MAPRKKNASRPSAESTHSFGGAVDTLRHARTGHGGGDEQPTRDKAKDTRREEALIYGRPIVDTGRRETPPVRCPVGGSQRACPKPGRTAPLIPEHSVSWRGPTAAADLAHGHGRQIAPSVRCHSRRDLEGAFNAVRTKPSSPERESKECVFCRCPKHERRPRRCLAGRGANTVPPPRRPLMLRLCSMSQEG